MRRLIAFAVMLVALIGSASIALAADSAATWSFGAGDDATVPKAVTTPQGKIVVDLSALPKDVKVFRAILRCSRDSGPGRGAESDKAIVAPTDAPDKPLALLAPRYRSFDATESVVAAANGKAEFVVKALRGLKPATLRLDVSFAGGAAKNAIPKAAALVATHRNGQTLITWKQPHPGIDKDTLTFAEWNARWKNPPPELRYAYRIYRSAEPFSAATIAKAQLIDEVDCFTCWNPDLQGVYPDGKALLTRYVVEDGGKPVAPGTGIYAHNPPPLLLGTLAAPAPPDQLTEKVQKAYYAVSVAVNGEENLADFTRENALAAALDEKAGPGDPILQEIQKPDKFFYTAGITLHHYVRWEAPPRHNLPSTPYDYLVIIPDKLEKPAPLNLILHCWGSNLYGKGGAFSWFGWQDKSRGIGVASNQIPYDWWTCYHENAGTWKAWTDGVVRDFTPKRLLAFVDWVATKWDVDPARVCVSGESMGGSGSTFIPIRFPDRFAYAYSAVGIHNPAAIKGSGFHESYAGNVGWMDAKLQHESSMPVWDYLNDPLIVRKDPTANLPFIGFGNGKNDGGIGWPHVVDLAKAFQETRQPHAVVWNLRGHGAGSFYPGGISFRTDRSLPAFAACSLDSDIGTATRTPAPREVKMPWGEIMKDGYDGDSQGQINTYLRWQTDDIVDKDGAWEMTVYLAGGQGGAPKDDCTVNVTPRRCQNFKPKPGDKFKWTNTSLADNKEVQSGELTADKYGLVTIEKITITKTKNRIKITRQ